MKSLHPEFDLLLVSVDPIQGGLARNLLEAKGIPSLMHGPDFDMAELGAASHNVMRHPDLYVPKGARDAARKILVEAWGEARVAESEPAGE
ncbi:MAG: DUF2007 domain-containing protein [Planctomycetes bacterium]|nr:DUF2007 domain-containing protein [Planctomycetota bacterium]